MKRQTNMSIWMLGAMVAFLTIPANADIFASVCVGNLDPANCTSTSTTGLVTKGNSGSGDYTGHPYAWSFAESAQVKDAGGLVPELGVSASISEYRGGYIAFLLPTYGLRLFASAGVSDQLTINNVSSGTLSLTWNLDGNAGFSLSDALASVGFVSQKFGNAVVWQGSTNAADDVVKVDSVTLTAPFTNNSLSYALSLQASFYCSYFYGALCTGDDAHPSNYNNFGDGSAFANFLNTATLSQVKVYDSQGNLVEDPGIVSKDGYLYPLNAPASAVPEPGSLAFLGLACLAGIAAHRKALTKRARN